MRTFLATLKSGMDNPVLVKDLRRLMRGKRVFIIQVVYLIILSLALYGVWVSLTLGSQAAGFQMRNIGRIIFTVLFSFQFFLVTYIGPAFTCGAVTGERERKTIDLLVTTLLKPRQIVWGKLGSSLSYITLLLISSVPLLCLSFLFGGVSPQEVTVSYLCILSWCALLGIIGVYISARSTRTLTATIGIYALIFFLFGPFQPFLFLLFGYLLPGGSRGFGSIVGSNFKVLGVPVPFWTALLSFMGWMFVFLLTKTNNILYGHLAYRSGLMRKLFLSFILFTLFLILGAFSSSLLSQNMTAKEEFAFFGGLIIALTAFFSLLSCVFFCEPPKPASRRHGFMSIFYPGSISGAKFLLPLVFISMAASSAVFFSRGRHIPHHIDAVLVSPAICFTYVFALAMLGIFFSFRTRQTIVCQRLLNLVIIGSWLIPLPGFVFRVINNKPQVFYGGSFVNPFLGIGSSCFEGWPQSVTSPWGPIPISGLSLLFYIALSLVFFTMVRAGGPRYLRHRSANGRKQNM